MENTTDVDRGSRACGCYAGIRVFVDNRRGELPLLEAIEAVSDDFIGRGMNCQQNLIDFREACRRLIAKVEALHDGLHGICYTIEMNNQQNGFWGVASAHGTIREKAVAAMHNARTA